MAASGMGQTESRQQLNRRNEDVSKMKAELSIEHAAKKLASRFGRLAFLAEKRSPI